MGIGRRFYYNERLFAKSRSLVLNQALEVLAPQSRHDTLGEVRRLLESRQHLLGRPSA
jgi:hypothetical protein